MKNIKLLHVYKKYFPDSVGGVEEAIHQICVALNEYGVESKIFALSSTPDPQKIESQDGVIIRARSWMEPASCDLGGPAAFSVFAKLMQEVDVVVYHFPWPFADLLHASIRPKIPSVMLYHSDVVRQRWLGKVYAPLMWYTLKSMSAVVATSPTYAQTSEVLKAQQVRDKVRVIPLGIADDHLKAEADDSIFASLGLADNEPFILFVGVLRYYKGLHTLVSAAPSVQARIIIAGSGPEINRLKLQADKEGVKNIIFAGKVSDAQKNSLFRSCRAFVLPSHLRSEAFGMVLVEAALFGCPMVSCEIGSGTSFVNAHGETGLVVEPENPSALAGALNQLILDPAMAKRYGIGARARYERLFSKEALGSAYMKLFRQLNCYSD